MATTRACSELLDTFPRLARSKRALLGHLRIAPVSALGAVATLGPVRVSEVAEALGLDLSTVSRQVGHLREQGLVEAVPDAADGRSQRLSATEAGLDVLRAERRRVVERLGERLAGWDDAELGQLIGLLGRLTEDLTAPPTAPLPRAAADLPTARPAATTARTA